MKHGVKYFGMIALVAIIGALAAGCGNPASPKNNGGEQKNDLSGDITISPSGWTVWEDYSEATWETPAKQIRYKTENGEKLKPEVSEFRDYGKSIAAMLDDFSLEKHPERAFSPDWLGFGKAEDGAWQYAQTPIPPQYCDIAPHLESVSCVPDVWGGVCNPFIPQRTFTSIIQGLDTRAEYGMTLVDSYGDAFCDSMASPSDPEREGFYGIGRNGIYSKVVDNGTSDYDICLYNGMLGGSNPDRLFDVTLVITHLGKIYAFNPEPTLVQGNNFYSFENPLESTLSAFMNGMTLENAKTVLENLEGYEAYFVAKRYSPTNSGSYNGNTGSYRNVIKLSTIAL